MRKLRLCGIMFALFLIIGGVTGFVYLINIGGAGPEISWGIGMGPLAIGIILFLISMAKEHEKNSLLT